MSDKTWKPWNDVNYCSAKHHADITEKARYDTKFSKSAGWGCNMPSRGLDNVVYVNNPAGTREDPAMRADRLQLIASWGLIKEQELTRRPTDARFCSTLFIPVPNELSISDDVNIGAEICTKLFGQEYAYSFSIHRKESERKEAIPTGKAAAYSVTNNHIHVMFSERSMVTGKKGSGDGRPFKKPDALRRLINDALAESLVKRGYKIGSNGGQDKKVRVSPGEYQANRMQEEAEIAVDLAEKAVEEKRAEIAVLAQDLEVTQKEFEAQGKATGKYHASPEAAARIAEVAAKVSTTQDLTEKLRTQSQDRHAREGQQPKTPVPSQPMSLGRDR